MNTNKATVIFHYDEEDQTIILHNDEPEIKLQCKTVYIPRIANNEHLQLQRLNNLTINTQTLNHLSTINSRTVGSVLAANFKAPDSRVTTGFHQRSQELSLKVQNTLSKRIGPSAAKQISSIEAPEKFLSDIDKQRLETDVHYIPLQELAKRFNTDVNTGLTTEQVKTNRNLYGNNILTPASDASYLLLFAKQLVSGFSFLLWIATIVIFLSWYPLGQLNGLTPQTVNVAVAALLLVVIFISAIFNFWMEIRAIAIIKSFTDIVPVVARVRRDGVDMQIPASDLVVGDIVNIMLGDKIPADVRLTSVDSLQVNNSALTGESEPIQCTTRFNNLNFMESANMAFYGTLVPQGSGKGLVVATGDQTVMGQINELTQSDFNNETSLHREILRFVAIVATAALFTGICFVIVWSAYIYPNHPKFLPVASLILNLVALIVAYVPEGLPVAVTLTLTLIAKRMYSQHVLVKNLAIIETFNSVSMICSDKTGTLTINQMSVSNILFGLKHNWAVPQVQSSDLTDINQARERIWNELAIYTKEETFTKLLLGAALCNNAILQQNEEQSNTNDENKENKGLSVLGDAADTALYKLLLEKLLVDPEIYRKECPRLKMLPFNSKNKFMAAWHNVTKSRLLNLNRTENNRIDTSIIWIKGLDYNIH